MTFSIRCLAGTTQLWSETFSNEPDALHYYTHKAKLAQQYGPTATPFRFEFLRDGELIDAFETNAVEDT
jgi:hypothetical protein